MGSCVEKCGFYQKLSGLADKRTVFKNAMANFNPSLLMACTKENPELGAEVIKRIEDEKGYVHLDYKELVRSEKKRKTELGLKLIKSFSDNYMYPYELLRGRKLVEVGTNS